MGSSHWLGARLTVFLFIDMGTCHSSGLVPRKDPKKLLRPDSRLDSAMARGLEVERPGCFVGY